MAEGQVYVEVDASVINGGVMPMAIVSGNPEPIDGQSYVVVWIRWRYDDATGDGGYTGYSWYFDDPNNNIKKHYSNQDDFIKWLITDHPTDLNSVLSDWSADSKAAFLTSYNEELSKYGCVYFTAN